MFYSIPFIVTANIQLYSFYCYSLYVISPLPKHRQWLLQEALNSSLCILFVSYIFFQSGLKILRGLQDVPSFNFPGLLFRFWGKMTKLFICDPLPQNQEQVLFYINWVIGVIIKGTLSALSFDTKITYLSIIYLQIWPPVIQTIQFFLQKFIVRKWRSKFTFYININAN